MSQIAAQTKLSNRAETLLDGNLIVPVIEIDDAAEAVPFTRALAAGGITLVEITFRTPAGLDAVRAAAAKTDSTVGAGAVLHARGRRCGGRCRRRIRCEPRLGSAHSSASLGARLSADPRHARGERTSSSASRRDTVS